MPVLNARNCAIAQSEKSGHHSFTIKFFSQKLQKVPFDHNGLNSILVKNFKKETLQCTLKLRKKSALISGRQGAKSLFQLKTFFSVILFIFL